MQRVRERIARELPELRTYFQSGGLVDSVLNQGMPAPIDIQVSGMDLKADDRVAQGLAREIKALPMFPMSIYRRTWTIPRSRWT